MKKRILALTLSLLLALSTSACGTQATAGNGSSQDVQNGSTGGNDDSAQNVPDTSDGSNDSAQNVPDTSVGSSLGFPGSSDLPDSLSTTAGIYADLQEWADSEEATAVIETTNRTLTSTGITFDLAIDGSILIYKYYLPNDSWVSGLSEEKITAAFAPLIESMSSTVDTIFTTFANEYGLTVDVVRFVYYSAGGAELYSKDFMP